MLDEDKKLMGTARQAPMMVLKKAMEMVSKTRYGMPFLVRLKSSSVSGWVRPRRMALATLRPCSVRPLKPAPELPQMTSPSSTKKMRSLFHRFFGSLASFSNTFSLADKVVKSDISSIPFTRSWSECGH